MRIIGDNIHQLVLSKYNLENQTIIYIENYNISETVIIPDHIKILEFDNCINVNFSINNFNNLEKLIIRNCLNIDIPSNLTQLQELYIYNDFDNYCSILNIPTYPNLKKMHLEKCPFLKNIKNNNLNELYIYKCNDIITIPDDLQKLTIIESYKLNKLSQKLTKLKYLYIDTGEIIDDERLINLNKQDINFNQKIKKIKKEITKFNYPKDDIYGFLYGYIKSIPNTLINLEELYLFGTNIILIPESLINLKKIILNNTQIYTIPNNCQSIERIDIIHNKNINTLPLLSKLTDLYLSDCFINNIHSYPRLQHLIISKCNKITKIPNLNKINDFYMYQCESIKKLPLLENVKTITIENCDNFDIELFINTYSKLMNKNIDININFNQIFSIKIED